MKANWIPLAGLALAITGCEASISGAPAATTTTTSAPVNGLSAEQAIKNITNVRCTRELACGNIGKDDVDACASDARAATRDVVLGPSCANGIDTERLATCLEDIRNVPSGPANDMVELFKSCRGMKLCL